VTAADPEVLRGGELEEGPRAELEQEQRPDRKEHQSVRNMTMKTCGGRAANIIQQYNINRVRNEVFMFFSKVHV
jgi:hypothetical protein